ncbi:MAG: hypothetical protein SPF41_03190 [Candidatus Merdousia sp.]|nr:hypothetical protein [Candidatus Merdousia sp.]
MKKALLMSLIAGATAVSATAATVSEVSSPITEGTTFVGEQVFEGQLAIKSVLLQIGTQDGSQTGILTIKNATNPLANGGRIQVNKGSTLYVYTGKNPGWGTASQGQRIDIYGTVETAYGTDSAQIPTDTNGYNLEVSGSGKELRVFDGGVFNFKNGSMRLNGGGIITLNKGSKTTVERVIFGGTGSKLIIGANDVLSTASGGKPSIVFGSSAKGTVDISATTDLKLGNIQLQGNSSLTINLSATHGLLTVAKFDINEVEKNPFNGTESLILNDFVNDTFKIEDTSNVEIVGDSLNITKLGASLVRSVKLVAKDADGNTLCGENEHWEIQNGFLNIVSNIPEPAEWAAIFGGIALALALYRRRR